MFGCWAKLGDDNDQPGYHPLLCHMIDVAMVALELWNVALSTSERNTLTRSLGFGGDQDSAGGWCAFIAGLHDLGKASPAFQLQVDRVRAEVRERLRSLGLPADSNYRSQRTPHGTITSATLPDILEAGFGLNRFTAQRIGVVVGGHHGIFPTSSEVLNVGVAARGRAKWDAHRRALAEELAHVLGLSRATQPDRIDNATAMVLAGFVSVADWVGSDVSNFPHRIPGDVLTYAGDSREGAKTALTKLGWLAKPGPSDVRSFAELFPCIPVPNNLQRSVESVATSVPGPGMVIIEAPMGEGKTEAAIFLADYWAAASGQEGYYFALPTQATSDQMFGRVRDFLQNRYEGERTQFQLLHGHAALSSEFEALRYNGDLLSGPEYPGVDNDGDELAVVASQWFTHRKRGLLAPFGVGTIDQALLGALQTRHVFVRLFGLAHKTIIVDEVHAYDVYMTTLLERLLEWLAALGSSVVLLSATLPKIRRERLMAAYLLGLGREPEVPTQARYPRISLVSRETEPQSRTVKVSARGQKAVVLEWIDGSLPDADSAGFPLGELLYSTLARGGCAAVVCNTVRRSQELYRALKPYFGGFSDEGEPVLDLLHSQYPFEDRQRRERRALARYGSSKDPTVRRPQRSILVATQIIEQSLDLDFDVMVSDMAPVDLLLQRVGRLHRHERARPEGLETPKLLVCKPEMVDGKPRFAAGTAAVYDEHILLRSWLSLRHRDVIQVPDDVETVVEYVYDDDREPDNLPKPMIEAWEDTREKLTAAMAEYRDEAQRRLIRPASYTGQLWHLTGNVLEEDAPEFHPTHQALTRLAPPSVPAVLLFGDRDATGLDVAHHDAVNTDQPPSLEMTKRLLMRSVTISDRRLVSLLLGQSPPPAWRKSPLLRNHRAIFVNESGVSQIGDYQLTLDSETGATVSWYG